MFLKKNKFYRFWPFSKIGGTFLLWYVIAIIFGAIILSTPISINQNNKNISINLNWNFFKALFTATSGFSDTGLTIINIGKNYSFFGQLILIILIQLGGFGLLTTKILFLMWIGKKITLKNKIIIQNERGSSILGTTIKIIKFNFIFLFCVEFVSAIFLFITFYFCLGNTSDGKISIPGAYHNYLKSLWYAIFHSISAINNAGFDCLQKGNSLSQYNSKYIFQFIFMFEFILGGIGFPVFYDLFKKIYNKINHKNYYFTLFSKISLFFYFLVSFFGVLIVLIIELFNHGDNSLLKHSSSNWNFFMNVFFNVMSTRNAGFSTINLNYFSNPSKLIMTFMMFVGSSPSSTAGGIRTTTLGVIFISVFSIIKNHNTSIFKREIPLKTVKKSFAVFFIATTILFFSWISSIIILNINKSEFNNNLDYLFILTSAFGTTGLNTMTTNQFSQSNIFFQIIIIFLMLLGQLGISNTLRMFKYKKITKIFLYPKEDVVVG